MDLRRAKLAEFRAGFNSVIGKCAAPFAVVAMCAATPALALEPKQCLPMAQMNEALKAEGQRTMIIGDRFTLQNDSSKKSGVRTDVYANAVTSNADGTLGYQLEGDLPRNRASTSMCVAAKLTNIKMFDAARPGVPEGALLGGRIDDMFKADETVGARPIVVADTVHKKADGKYYFGLPMVLTGNVPARVGAIYARRADGEPVMLARLINLDYTAAGVERARMARSPQP